MIILIVLYIIIMVTAGLGNLLTIIATFQNPNLRTCTNILICNLAVSDFIIATCSLPLQIYGVMKIHQSLWLCRCKVILAVFLFTLSNTNLVLISLDRFLGVNWPLQYKTRSSTFKLKIAIAFSWLFSLVLGGFPFVVVGDKKQLHDKPVYSNQCNYVGLLAHVYVTFLDFGIFFPAWLTIIILYLVICKKLYQSRNNPLRLNVKALNNGGKDFVVGQHESIVKCLIREIKYAKVVCLTVGVYTICLTPILVINILRSMSPSSVMNVNVVTFSAILLLLYSSAVLNPLIYGMTMPKYRNEFKKVWLYIFKRNRL